MSTTGLDERDSLSQKKRRGGVMKRNKLYCNLTAFPLRTYRSPMY